MASSTITYANKVALNENPSVADINKVKADDMNEIKTVVNSHSSDIDDIYNKLYTKDLLWSGTTGTGTINLDGSVEDYDFILIIIRGGSYTRGTTLIPVNEIEYGTGDDTPWSVVAFQTSSTYASAKINFSDRSTIKSTVYPAGWASANIKRVYGIKF